MFGVGVPELVIIILVFVIPGIGAWLAARKGRSAVGWFFLCLIFFPLVILVIFLRPVREVKGKIKQCPKCKEFIKWEASVCKHCGSSI